MSRSQRQSNMFRNNTGLQTTRLVDDAPMWKRHLFLKELRELQGLHLQSEVHFASNCPP